MEQSVESWDVVVVGSGFGGSVAALRLVEKGYRVLVLEAGRRFAPDDLPRTSWQLKDFLWAPRIGCTGIQRIHLLDDVLILAGAGVGGGSLNYANTLYRPGRAFYTDPQWAHITDWEAELAPWYDQASRMLGVVENPTTTPSDELVLEVARELGVDDTYRRTPVGVYFGDGPGVEAPDPFFGGAGPTRRGCTECGECMTGCRHGAKNTLLTNYLHLAERGGAVVRPLTTVTGIRPDGDGYVVTSRHTTERTDNAEIRCERVVLAAGTWGTQSLLHTLRETTLPDLSPRLGVLTRTNSESLIGAQVRLRDRGEVDFTKGVAITSSVHLDERTHLEPVRYGKGAQAMGALTTVLTDGGRGGRLGRTVRWVRAVLADPTSLASLVAGNGSWSERGVIALVMQDVDNSVTVRRTRFLRGHRLASTHGHGEHNPTWIPVANAFVRRMARRLDGRALGNIGEIADIPMTAHFLGGCTIGDGPDTGVIDAYHRVWGYPGISVVDGSAVSANLGVNPSLTITAQAERAFSLWPNRGDADPRPEQGVAYRVVEPVAPGSPVVPPDAPGAYRLPIVSITGG